VEACPAQALVVEGREVTVSEAMEELRRDAPFFETSGGGITLSGGEPMRQVQFSVEILAACKAEGFHTALDTSGYAPWEDYAKVLPLTDLVLFDFKLFDPEEHRKYTGVSNELIRENLARIDSSGVAVEVRIPVIPGINDSRQNIEESARFLRGFTCVQSVTLLPYHNLGESKYPRVGRTYRLEGLETPSREAMESIAGWIRSFGLTAQVQ
jgi:pyruvate formate lyase activating enzyme